MQEQLAQVAKLNCLIISQIKQKIFSISHVFNSCSLIIRGLKQGTRGQFAKKIIDERKQNAQTAKNVLGAVESQSSISSSKRLGTSGILVGADTSLHLIKIPISLSQFIDAVNSVHYESYLREKTKLKPLKSWLAFRFLPIRHLNDQLLLLIKNSCS